MRFGDVFSVAGTVALCLEPYGASSAGAVVMSEVPLCSSNGSNDVGRTGAVPREQEMLKGHLLGVLHYQVYWYTKNVG